MQHISFSLNDSCSLRIVYYYYRFKWKPLLVVTIILSYISTFIWLLGNPAIGNPMKLIAEQHSGVVYFWDLEPFFFHRFIIQKRRQI